jgi:hypothetical protein
MQRCPRSGQFFSRPDRGACRKLRWRVLAARKPFAIAEEFGDAKMEYPARLDICGLAARPGEETSAGCGLAQLRASQRGPLRRSKNLIEWTMVQRPVDKKTVHLCAAASSRRDRSARDSQPEAASLGEVDRAGRARGSRLGNSDRHSSAARTPGMGHGGVDTAHPGC